jgi:hypothetical protein
MEPKNLQKATKLLQQIHDLDKQIVTIEKLAMDVLENKNIQDIALLFTSPLKEKKETDIAENFADMYSPFSMLTAWKSYTSPLKEEKDKIKLDLSENELLCVIELVIRFKKDKRKFLVDKIYSLGVKLDQA